MHDIKFIKDNGPFFDDKLKKRNLPPISKILISLHNEYLEELKKVQTLQEKKNTLSKKFSSVSQKKEIEEIRYEVSQIKLKLDDSKKKK